MNIKRVLFLIVIHPVLITLYAQPLEKLGIRLEGYDYPFETRSFHFKSQNQVLEMVYMDITPDDPNNKTVVLMHGKNFNGAYWGETAERLKDNGFRVIIPDQIGFGKSTKPEHYQYTFHILAENTKALLDHTGVKSAIVLGHSMGGMLATRFALMYPEFTEKLVLVNPIGLEDWKRKVPYRPVDWWYKNELKKNYQSIKQYQLESYYDGQWKEAYDPWVNMLAGWTLHEDYPIIAWNAALTFDMIFTQPVVYEFELLQMPTLLIIGQRDRTALGKNLVSEEIKKTLGNYPVDFLRSARIS
ncbi:MAG: alpha/beta hydrolase [Bacteroidales bacterium]